MHYTPLSSLISAKGQMARHWIASARTESKLKVGFVSISAILLLGGAFFLSYGFFRGFQKVGNEWLGVENNIDLTDLLLIRLLSVFALTVFLLLILSNILVAFATLFRSREVAYLIQSPMSRTDLFLGRFYECITFSSWSLAFLGFPFLIAYGLAREAHPLFFVALILFFVPFVVTPAAIGSAICLSMVRLLAGRSRLALLGLGTLAAVVVLIFRRTRSSVRPLTETETVQNVLELMAQTQSPFLPSHWLAEGLLAASVGDWGNAAFFWLLTTANALFATMLVTVLAEKIYYDGWTLLGSGKGRAPGEVGRGPLSILEELLSPISEPRRTLMAKDIRLFWRDPAQWTQFLIFFGLLGFYLANLRNDGVLQNEPFRSFIALLNMAASMLVLATLTTRFVFPLISLEGRRFWILGLAPLSKSTLLWQKFWLSVVTTSLITVTLALISGMKLDLTRYELGLSVFAVFTTTVALSGLAVGLGSLYPNFEEDNPSRITSGMGGTLNFILSLVYIAVVTTLQGILLQWSRVEAEGGVSRDAATSAVILTILALAVVTAGTALHLGWRNLERAEF